MKYKVIDAVWLGAAVLAYETYYKSDEASEVSTEDMYFQQSIIQKKAQQFSDGKVQNARVNQWCNGDHKDNSYNYLKEGKNGTRRLTVPGEFNGYKEMPTLNDSDKVDTIHGEIEIKKLVNFVINDYKVLFSTDERDKLLTETKCIKILDFLDEYANREYKSPNKETDSVKKEELLTLKRKGSEAVNELKKMTLLCERDFGVKMVAPSKWLNGGNNKVRAYQWIQLKKLGKEKFPTSLSIFAEIQEGKARFRFSVEINDAQSNTEDYIRHHRLLDIDIKNSVIPLVYFKGGNNSDGGMVELNLSTEEVKEVLKNGDFTKVQISRVITREDIEERIHHDFGILNVMGETMAALEPYYDKAVWEDDDVEDIKEAVESIETIGFDKNMILYGPPGTGKTYNTINYAVAIIENKTFEEVSKENHELVLKRFNKYKNEDNKITFTTFHQSYGYEEFIEGIKPKLNTEIDDDEADKLEYTIEPGVFKEFCDSAKQEEVNASSIGISENPTIWKISLERAGRSDTKEDCFTNNRIRIGWSNKEEYLTDESEYSSAKEKRILLYFQDEMKVGDIVLTLYDQYHIDGIGIIEGDYEWLEDGGNYKRSRRVNWIATRIKENIFKINKNTKLTSSTVYRLDKIELKDIVSLIDKYLNDNEIGINENQGNYVFIIDEINRGNISKIFGELITLIESTKRIGNDEEMKAKLPYSGKEFGVPNNVYILGTMNTADRSIALMDTALRRRFKFVEMMPNSTLLENINIQNIDLKQMLLVMNKRIELLYDREHTIGHAYFKNLENNPSIENLADVFRNKIIPLLQEYFYEDYSKIQLILGDNDKEAHYKFILDEEVKAKNVFKGNLDIDIPEKKYSIQARSFDREESYIQIYE